jgi:WD40 repeat protein
MLILAAKKQGLNSITFSPDGAWLAARANDGAVRAWALPEGRLVHAFSASEVSFSRLFFLGPGLLGLVSRLSVKRFRLEDGTWAPEVRAPAGWAIWRALGTPDGTRLCLSYERRLRCLGLPSGEPLWNATGCPAHEVVTALGWSSNGRFLLAGGCYGSVRLLDASAGTTVEDLPAPGFGTLVTCVSVASSGAAAWCAATTLVFRRDDGTISQNRLSKTHFLGVAWHPSGEFFATANGDGKVDYWDARTGERRQSFDWDVGKLNAVAFDATGDRAACCSESGKVVIWDVDR